TIHKRLWDLISPYNKQLVAIHLWNLRKELYKENKYIYDNKEFGHLTKEAQNDFIKVMKEYKNDFYAFYNDKAAIARENYEKILSSNDINNTNLLKSIGRFKQLVTSIYRKEKYLETIKNICNKKAGYMKVNYNTHT